MLLLALTVGKRLRITVTRHDREIDWVGTSPLYPSVSLQDPPDRTDLVAHLSDIHIVNPFKHQNNVLDLRIGVLGFARKEIRPIEIKEHKIEGNQEISVLADQRYSLDFEGIFEGNVKRERVVLVAETALGTFRQKLAKPPASNRQEGRSTFVTG